MRAGAQTLTLLGAPRNFLILQALADGALGQRDLRRRAGYPAQSTLRSHLTTLCDLGAIDRHRQDSFPGAIHYGLTDRGRELLAVTEHLERWLGEAPAGPLALGDDASRAAVKALVDGWSTTVLTTLATEPLSLTELDRRISVVSYPTIERCLETMRLAGQLEAGDRGSGGTPYATTPWLRRGLAALVAAAAWEHRNRPDEAIPLGRDDVEGAFAIAVPLLELPVSPSGICQVAMRSAGGKPRRHLAFLEVRRGKIAMHPVYPQRKPDAWASATADTWFSTLIDANSSGLRLSGERKLTEAILEGIHRSLFAPKELATQVIFK